MGRPSVKLVPSPPFSIFAPQSFVLLPCRFHSQVQRHRSPVNLSLSARHFSLAACTLPHRMRSRDVPRPIETFASPVWSFVPRIVARALRFADAIAAAIACELAQSTTSWGAPSSSRDDRTAIAEDSRMIGPRSSAGYVGTKHKTGPVAEEGSIDQETCPLRDMYP